MAVRAARRGPHDADQRAGHPRRDDHGRAAAPARLHGRLRRRTPAWSRSTCPERSATGPTTTWSGRCAPRSRVLGPAGRPLRRGRRRRARAATRSARAGSTCTPRGCEALGATVHVDARLPRRRGAARAARRRHPAGLPERRGDRERAHGRGARRRARPGIDNAAREPEIVDIAEMLVVDGRARSTAPAPRVIEVEGVDGARPTEHAVVPDRIAAGTWAFAAATTRGDIEVVGGVADHLQCAARRAGGRAAPTVDVTDRGLPGRRRRRRPPVVRRRDAALPGLPDRPAAVRAGLQRRRRRLRHDHREPLRGALPHRAGAGPARAPTPAIDGHHVMVHGVAAALGRAGRGQRHPRRRRPRHRRAGRRRGHHRQRRPPRRPRLRRVRRGACGASAPTSPASPTTTSLATDAGFARDRCGWLAGCRVTGSLIASVRQPSTRSAGCVNVGKREWRVDRGKPRGSSMTAAQHCRRAPSSVLRDRAAARRSSITGRLDVHTVAGRPRCCCTRSIDSGTGDLLAAPRRRRDRRRHRARRDRRAPTTAPAAPAGGSSSSTSTPAPTGCCARPGSHRVLARRGGRGPLGCGASHRLKPSPTARTRRLPSAHGATHRRPTRAQAPAASATARG